MRLVVIAAIARDNCKPVVNGRRGYEEVRLRERMTGFPAFLNQKPQFQHDVLGDLEDPTLEHRT